VKARAVAANLIAGLSLGLTATCVGSTLLGEVALGTVAGVIALLAGVGVWVLSAPEASWPGDWPQVMPPAAPDRVVLDDLEDADAQAFAVLIEQERARGAWPEWPDAEVAR
jgi:hypothetical protein